MIPNLVLDPDEAIVIRQKPHWSVFQPVLSLLLITLFILFITLLTGALHERFNGLALYEWFTLGLMILTSLLASSQWLEYEKTYYLLTNKRIIVISSIWGTKQNSIVLQGIESTRVEKSITGRYLGCGDIYIRSLGNSQQVIFNIPKPEAFQEAIYAVAK